MKNISTLIFLIIKKSKIIKRLNVNVSLVVKEQFINFDNQFTVKNNSLVMHLEKFKVGQIPSYKRD